MSWLICNISPLRKGESQDVVFVDCGLQQHVSRLCSVGGIKWLWWFHASVATSTTREFHVRYEQLVLYFVVRLTDLARWCFYRWMFSPQDEISGVAGYFSGLRCTSNGLSTHPTCFFELLLQPVSQTRFSGLCNRFIRLVFPIDVLEWILQLVSPICSPYWYRQSMSQWKIH